MNHDTRKNLANCAIEDMTTDELRGNLKLLGFGADMDVKESPEYQEWEMRQWYRPGPDEKQLTQAEFNAKYKRNTRRTQDDSLEPGTV